MECLFAKKLLKDWTRMVLPAYWIKLAETSSSTNMKDRKHTNTESKVLKKYLSKQNVHKLSIVTRGRASEAE